MKTNLIHSLSIILLFIYTTAPAQNIPAVSYNPNLQNDTSRKSIKSIAIEVINKDTIKINYYSPGVRKRVIWGGLVPYDKIWVTGAHDATSIEINKTFSIGGKEIAPGKYAIFTIPGSKKWTVILNRNWQQHQTSQYSEKDDLLRITVKPKKRKHLERLQYFITAGKNNHVTISMRWEKLQIEIPVTIK